MLKFIIVLLIQINLLCALTPNWVGTFTVDKSCDPSRCCCFDGKIEITNKFSNKLTLTAGVKGAAAYCGISHTMTFYEPTGFSTMLTSDGDKFFLLLNKDSRQLSIEYEQEDMMRCSGHATKINA